MSDAQNGTPAEIQVTPELQALVGQVMDQVALGKVTLAEAVSAALGDQAPSAPAPSTGAFVVPQITDEQKKALRQIVDLYGQVVPTEPRLLTPTELTLITKERKTIDLLLKFLEARKEESIRETLAYHLDKVAEAQDDFDPETAPKDRRGHYAVKQKQPVPDTDLNLNRSVSHPKPTIDGATIQALHEQGVLDRAEYLALTSMPVVKRNFDETKAREAFKKNPALLFKVAKAVKQGLPTTTIKVN